MTDWRGRRTSFSDRRPHDNNLAGSLINHSRRRQKEGGLLFTEVRGVSPPSVCVALGRRESQKGGEAAKTKSLTVDCLQLHGDGGGPEGTQFGSVTRAGDKVVKGRKK